MNETMNNGATNQNTQAGQEWVFIPLSKELILKSTDDYILFKLGGGATTIVSAKFKRKKESDEKIFLSVPETYEFNCQRREFDKNKNRYVPVERWSIKAKELKELLSNNLPF